MPINYVLATLFAVIAYQLFVFAYEVKNSKQAGLVIPKYFVKWMALFKVSSGVGYTTAAIWQFLAGWHNGPIVPVAYLSFVLFVNAIILYNIMQVRKHLKL